MRTALILFALLAGCTQLPASSVETPASVADAIAPFEPFLAEGTLWLPPSTEDRVETLIPFPVNASGARLLAHAELGSTYGPLDSPITIADVLLELRAPDGTVLAEGRLGMEGPTADLEATSESVGEHTLAILSYGGSDEEANGDRVDWRIETKAPG